MEILKTGFEVTVIGMGVVFLVLIFLSLTLKLFEFLFYRKKGGAAIPESGNEQITTTDTQITATEIKESPGEVEGEEERRVVAAICAVMASLLERDEYICNIRQL